MKWLRSLLLLAAISAAPMLHAAPAEAQTCNAMAAFRTWYTNRFNLLGSGTLNSCAESWHSNTSVDVDCQMFSDLGLFTSWNFDIYEVGPVNPGSHSFQALHAHSYSNYDGCYTSHHSGAPMSVWWWDPPTDIGGVYCSCTGPNGTASCVTAQFYWQNPH